MQITEQVILTLLTAICAPVLVGAIGIWAVWSKNRAIAARERVEADAEKIKAEAALVMAEAEKMKAEAEAKLAREKGDVTERQQVMQMFQQQITINEQAQKEREIWWKELDKKEKRDESNYQVMKNVQRDVTITILNEIKSQAKQLSDKIDGIPTQITSANSIALGEFAKTLGGEIGLVIAEQFTRQKAESSLYPYPDVDDPMWHDDVLTPIVPDATIFREPRLWDNAKLQKPCAKIAADGERARVITGRIPGWVAIDKYENGVRCWGWLPEFAVKVGEAEKLPA